jgi:hypothetical protein
MVNQDTINIKIIQKVLEAEANALFPLILCFVMRTIMMADFEIEGIFYIRDRHFSASARHFPRI